MTGPHADLSNDTIMKPLLMNACLTFVKSLMSRNNKDFIKNATIHRFDFQVIKDARKMLFKHCEPDVDYGY